MRSGAVHAMHHCRTVCVILLIWNLVPCGAPASDADPAPEVAESIAEARQFIYEEFDYNSAIDVLTPVLEATQSIPELLRESYLLLIEAYVLRGNRSASDLDRALNHEKATDWIRTCLSTRALRHTHPDPGAVDTTIEYFEQVRREIFGTFEITSLEPADAEVVFDGDLLVPDENGLLRQEDVPIGSRVLQIHHESYADWTEDVTIEASRVVSRPYVLEKNKGVTWYLTRIGVPVVVVAGIVAAVIGSGGSDEEPEQPLPGPPDPPARR